VNESAQQREGRSRWHYLLLVPIVVPLWLPLYDRLEPRLFGFPFFYWAQMAFIVLTMIITILVHMLTRRRGNGAPSR
jgi:hypothetical protein